MRTDTSNTQGSEAVAACLGSPLPGQLAAAGIISKAGVRRCRRRVSRLARQFPPSDYLWVESLQRGGYLTLFQARALTEGQPEVLVVGDYVLLDQIGGSDLATTYRARNRRTRQLMAVRVFSRDLGDPAALARKLEQYERQCAAVGSPEIVQPLEIGAAGDRVFLAAEWVDGPSLPEMMNRRGRIPSRQALEIARQIAVALAAAQRQGLVHGDLRPSNILITLDGSVRLTDFGLRWLVAPETLKPRLTAGPERYEYLAPEITVGAGRPGTRSELYSLGCLIYHLLAGRPPFPGGDAHSKCAAHQTRPAPDLSVSVPEADRARVELTQRMIDRDPSRRPANFDVWLAQIGPSSHETRRRLAAYVGGKRWRERSTAGAQAAFGGEPEVSLGRRRWGWLVAVVLVASLGAGLTLQAPAVRGWIPLSFSTPAATQHTEPPDPPTTSPATDTSIYPKPERRPPGPATHAIDRHDHASAQLRQILRSADDGDTIELRTVGPFVVEDLVVARRLVLRGAPDVRPLLVVRKGRSGMVLLARGIRLESLHFLCVDGPEGSTQPSSGATNQQATTAIVEVSAPASLDRCSFQDLATDHDSSLSAVHFAPMTEPTNAAGRASETLDITDCYFHGVDTAIRVSTADPSPATIPLPDRGAGLGVRANNCLQREGVAFVRVVGGAQARNRKLQLALRNVSSVEAQTLVEYRTSRPSNEAGRVELTADNCVAFPAEGGSVVRLAYADPVEPPLPIGHIAWSGKGNRCPPGASTLVLEGPRGKPYLTATGPAGWADFWATTDGGFSATSSAPPPAPSAESHTEESDDGIEKPQDPSRPGVAMVRLRFPGEPVLQQLPTLLQRAWSDLPR